MALPGKMRCRSIAASCADCASSLTSLIGEHGTPTSPNTSSQRSRGLARSRLDQAISAGRLAARFRPSPSVGRAAIRVGQSPGELDEQAIVAGRHHDRPIGGPKA